MSAHTPGPWRGDYAGLDTKPRKLLGWLRQAGSLFILICAIAMFMVPTFARANTMLYGSGGVVSVTEPEPAIAPAEAVFIFYLSPYIYEPILRASVPNKLIKLCECECFGCCDGTCARGKKNRSVTMFAAPVDRKMFEMPIFFKFVFQDPTYLTRRHSTYVLNDNIAGHKVSVRPFLDTGRLNSNMRALRGDKPAILPPTNYNKSERENGQEPFVRRHPQESRRIYVWSAATAIACLLAGIYLLTSGGIADLPSRLRSFCGFCLVVYGIYSPIFGFDPLALTEWLYARS